MDDEHPRPDTPDASARGDPTADGLAILAGAVERFRPVKVFALFSGGHDSLCSSHLASRSPRFDGCVHIDTGTGVPDTRAFVHDTCRQFGWPLQEYRPPVSYEEIVLRWGFPGPAGHTLVYNRLKERCLRQLGRDHKAKRSDLILLVTGIRRQESRRRMGYLEPVQRKDGRVWAAPLLDWSHADKRAYLDAHRLPLNPVVERLCMSGECLCGAFARKGGVGRDRLLVSRGGRPHPRPRRAGGGGRGAVPVGPAAGWPAP